MCKELKRLQNDYNQLESKFLEVSQKYESHIKEMADLRAKVSDLETDLKEKSVSLVEIGELFETALLKIELFLRVPIWRLWWWKHFHPYKFSLELDAKKIT